MRHFFYIFLPVLLLSIGVSPGIVQAQTLEYDQRCFTKEECLEARSSILRSDEDVAAGFIQNDLSNRNCGPLEAEQPGSEVGFCTAGGAIDTQVTIGGKTRFDDIGDFINTIYRYSFSVAIVLAVIVILVSGIQWMSSGGNSSVISDAKKRIGGAALGLFLLAGAYTILNTINPALTTLRQPNVYLIRANVLEPIISEQLCDPDGSGPYGTCPDTHYCLETKTVNVDDQLDGSCEKLALGAILAPTLIPILGTTLPAAGPAITTALSNGAGRVVQFIPYVNGNPLTLGSIATFGKAAVKLAGVTIVADAGYELVSFADRVTGLSAAARLQYQQFVNSEGICVERDAANTLQAGDLCSTDPNANATCANGLNCISDPLLNSALGCWDPNVTLGVCSSGGRGSRCTQDSDCTVGTCREFDLPGRLLDGKICSDGGEGAYCENDNDCNGSCVDNICTAFAAQNEFDLCTASANCDNIPGGIFKCFELQINQCSINPGPLLNNLGGTIGVCLDTDGGASINWKGRDPNTYYEATNGTRYYEYDAVLGRGGERSLFFKMADILGDNGNTYTFDANRCGGRFSESNAAYRNELRRYGHSVQFNGSTLGPIN